MRKRLPLLCIALLASAARAAEVPPDITVAIDGSAKFTSIQSALESVPKDNKERIVIFVKNGVYKEKIRVDASFITLRGESRENTRIEYPQLYNEWQRSRDPLGRAVLNLGPSAAPAAASSTSPAGPTGSDFILQNITVKNTSGVHGHSFVVYTETADRLIMTDANILGTGGDSLAPMNLNLGPAGGGRYYFSRLDVHGAVDFVCPKGTCYMSDSHLFEEIADASTWHNGSANKDQKFVMRNIKFEGVDKFNLGRHHVAANMYYLDCTFGKNIADRAPYLVRYPNNKAQEVINDKMNLWGERIYFYNSHKEDGNDFPWMKNNLDTAEGSPKPDQITAAWTFGNTWDPESKTAPTITSVVWREKPATDKQPAIQQVAVTFSESVTVKGKPQLTLVQGAPAPYISGSGTDTLLFTAAAPGTVKGVDLNGGLVIGTEATVAVRDAQLALHGIALESPRKP